ncbi:uncharacterized protein LOC133515638 [Cydia pomonella]|uniref:uncharacterized protein LOC133515638 n=1 Tax=Cydia pomonella TaxID=82600 RepID=UPI002ADE3A31|nr:uncharacterized protein LOC133515638 [Cydia pomonella]
MYFLILFNSFIAISALELRVFHGVDLDPKQHRHLVLLEINGWYPKDDAICTGSIISEEWIITAAHCVANEGEIESITVRQFNKKINRILTHVMPYDIFTHSLFINDINAVSNLKNDIALLKASNRIIFDNYVSPIELAQVPPHIGDSVIMAGYGVNEITKMMPRQGVAKLTKCPSDDYEDQWCIYDHVKTSPGDSGGPLTHNGKLVGIISGGYKCLGKFQLLPCLTNYPKVTYHYDWILNVMIYNGMCNNSIANSGYDIALLKTSKPLVFDDYAKAIDPARVSPRNNQWAIIAGYGQNELGKSFPRQSAVKVSKCFFDNSGRLLCSNRAMYFLTFLSALIAISALDVSRVYNGVDLDPIDQGYLVLLRIYTTNGTRMRCSGSILTANWIVTAAHCLQAQRLITMVSVEQDTNEVSRTLGTVRPNNTVSHPSYVHGKYSMANTQYDIALLKISKPISFDEYARPIELARVSPRNNQSAIIAGYGLTELGELLPRRGVVRVTKCPFNHSGFLLCSNSTVKSGPGDSGGALASTGKLVGVISGVAKYICDLYEQNDPEYPCTSIYVNVAAHSTWIKNVTGIST